MDNPPPEPGRLFRAAVSARHTGIHWTGDAAGAWTAAAQGKEAFVVVVDGGFEARVYHQPTGPDGPDPELARGPQRFATAGGALDYARPNSGPSTRPVAPRRSRKGSS